MGVIPHSGASLVTQMVKNLPAVQKIWVWSLGQEDPLEKRMTTHSGILAWEIPWTEEYCGLQSTGLQRVGQDWVANTFAFSATFTTDALWDLWKWKLYYVSPQYPSTQHNSHLEESLSISALGIRRYELQINSKLQPSGRLAGKVLSHHMDCKMVNNQD